MKIATFNINNINKRLPNLLEWLRAEQPDVACLQELKAAQQDSPAAAIEQAGYGAVWCGERTWNGVAILARDAVPVVTRRARRAGRRLQRGADRVRYLSDDVMER
jgi:exodeoxyribonuclease III